MSERIEGTKFDAGKERWDLLPWDALEQVVKVYTAGSLKYKPRNWELGIAYSRIVGALFRHIVHRLLGSKKDFESGLNPMAHATWSCLAILAYDLRGMDSRFDDVSPGKREHEVDPKSAKA